jgi:hypothetical protein
MNVKAAAATMSATTAAVMEELDERLYGDTRPMSETVTFIRHCNRLLQCISCELA